MTTINRRSADTPEPLKRKIIPRRPDVQLPPAARNTDPETSHIAAGPPRLSLALTALGFYAENDRSEGWTRDEVTARFEESGALGACPWKRVSECYKKGWLTMVWDTVNDQPLYRPGRHSGGLATQQVLRITPQGQDVWEVTRSAT